MARRLRGVRGRAAGLRIGIGVLLASLAAAGAAERRAALPSALAPQGLVLDLARAGERLVAVGEWGHVLLSDDQGRSWRQARSVPSQATLTAVCFVSAEEGWAVGHDAVILHTRNGGESWRFEHEAPALEAPLLGVWFENARHGLAVGAFGLVLETRDAGATWSRRTLVERAEGEEDPHLNDIFAGSGGRLFVAAEFGLVFRSEDAGRSWERRQLPYEGSFWSGLSLGGASALVFGMRGHVFRTEDGGESWKPVPSPTRHSLQAGARLAGGDVVLVGLGGTLLHSRDGARSFRAETEEDRRGIAAVLEAGPQGLVLAGETGVRWRELSPPAREGS